MPLLAVSRNQILAVAKSLPTAPRIYSRLQSALECPTTGLDEIVDLVRIDSGLSAGVVRQANSVIHARGEPVRSVDEAINRVGLREVHRLVGLTIAEHMFGSSLPLYGLSANALWEHSLATALALSALARQTSANERFAYTLGLLRPVGRLVLQRIAIEEGVSEPGGECRTGHDFLAWERENFGTTSAQVAAELMLEWGFPPEVSQALYFEHQPDLDPRRAKLPALLHLGCWISATLQRGLSCEIGYWQLGSDVVAQAGFWDGEVEAMVPEVQAEFSRISGSLTTGGQRGTVSR